MIIDEGENHEFHETWLRKGFTPNKPSHVRALAMMYHYCLLVQYAIIPASVFVKSISKTV